MGKINWGRVILGGLVAGVVINVSEFILHTMVVGEQWKEAMKALNLSGEPTTQQIVVWNIWGFLVGIATVWLYAAIRPRFNPGAGTAVKAGIAVWFFTHLLMTLGMWNMGLFPQAPWVIGLVWTFVETIVAALVGGWIYKEA